MVELKPMLEGVKFRLMLLAATGVVLSVASGWTTWDGMRNFTNESALSLLITFGIQGVMLAIAWLIGESFAAGMSRETSENWRKPPRTIVLVAAIVVVSTLAIAMFAATGGEKSFLTTRIAALSPISISAIAFTFIAACFVILSASTSVREIFASYLQSAQVMARNAMLWVMFLSCMATSVFFSFDSLFATIFSKEERLRAADVRARSETTQVVKATVELAAKRHLQERTSLLASPEWAKYAAGLDELAGNLQATPDAIAQHLQEGQFKDQAIAKRLDDHNARIRQDAAVLEQRRASIKEQKRQLADQLNVLREKTKSLGQRIFEKDDVILAKASEVEAEERGLGNTATAGQGPVYRKLRAELEVLQRARDTLQAQSQAYQERLHRLAAQVADLDRDAARVGEQENALRKNLRKLQGSTELEKRTAETAKITDEVQTALDGIARARFAFEQNPSRVALDALQGQCAAGVGVARQSTFVSTNLTSRSCDPSKIHEQAARLYALEEGTQILSAKCNGGDQIASEGGIIAALSWSRNCLQSSGLDGSDIAGMLASLDGLERIRDDKAHRFVVTINAFSDGNRLAYLALAIAIAIDGLVFMSGLFGANALRSPLQTIPQRVGRSARQLEAILQNALLPDRYETATLALKHIRPLSAGGTNQTSIGWTHEIDLDGLNPITTDNLSKLINAAATIRAAKQDENRPNCYHLRAEFIEFLNDAAVQAYSDDQTNTEQFAIRNAIKTALGSDVSVDACTILTYLTPSSEKDGFSSQLRLADVCAEKREMVQRCMNAAATVGCITCVGEPGKYERILVKNTFCRALLAMADTAATIKAASTEANPEPIVQNTASPRRDYKSRGGIKPARQSKSTNPELPKSVLTRSAERRRNAPKHQVSTVALGMEKKDSAPCGEPHKPSTTSVKETKKPTKVSITGDTITFE